jgi:surface antigen
VFNPPAALFQKVLNVLMVWLLAGNLIFLSFYIISSDSADVRQLPALALGVVKKISDIRAFIRPADAKRYPVITAHAVSPAAAIPVPVTLASAALKPPVMTAGNSYAWGNCTWWAAKRRAQVDFPIPNSWGNAATWARRAAADGYAVDQTPSPGAIMYFPSRGYLGHVAFVESVSPDGSWLISEMNVRGLGVVSYQTLPAAAAANYNFIH